MNNTDCIKILGKFIPMNKYTDCSKAINFDWVIEGYDADCLLEDIANEYKVDFSGFDFYDFFYDEGEIFMFGVFRYWLMKASKEPKKPLTALHLCNVIKERKWFDPPETE